MALVLVSKTFRHESGSLAKRVPVEVVGRGADITLLELTTDDLGHVSFYIEPGSYDFKYIGRRFPFDVVVEGASEASFVHTQLGPSASWIITHNLGEPRDPVILLDDDPTAPVWTDVHHSPGFLVTTIDFPTPATGRAYF